MNVVPFRPRAARTAELYRAKGFSANTEFGPFLVSGTLCGNIDVAVPQGRTYTLSADEVVLLVAALQNARTDTLENSDPLHDPRIVEAK